MSKITIAIQKSGRLTEKSLNLFKAAGIKVSNGSSLKTSAQNFPLEILFLRDDDIPQYVANGVADLGILGRNEVLEKQKDVQEIMNLGFGKCRLSLAIPRDQAYQSLNDFQGKTIATSYPNILNQFLQENKIEANIEEISGSVEVGPSIGLSDAVFDIVSTGSTLTLNGLKEVEEVCKSEVVLIANKDLEDDKKMILDKLLFRINAVMNAKENKYILLNAPNEAINRISEILPGMRSPSVLPLANSGWSSLHSVIQEKAFWEIIDQLKEEGAEGILVLPIEKMIV
jgi:ATP phosphoribosyltransferase